MTEKPPGGIMRRIMTSRLRDASAGRGACYSLLAKELIRKADLFSGADRQIARTITRGKVQRMEVKLRDEYPFLDEILDYYELGYTPENYWDTLVFYSYLRHDARVEEVVMELPITKWAAYKAVQRFQKKMDSRSSRGLITAEGWAWLAKIEGNRRRYDEEEYGPRGPKRKKRTRGVLN